MRKGLVAGALAGLIVAALGGVGGPALRLDAAIPAPLQVGPSDPSLPELNLVVLGDSYASAALPFDRGTLQVLGAPSVCARGPAWPRLLMPANMRLSLTHVSCSGAVVADLIDRRMRAGEILQVQALSEETDIVMLGIGGNDAGFSEVFAACRTEDASACVTAGERMKPQAAALSGSLVRLYRTVLAKAPNAVVIVVMYADSLPAAGTPGLDACSALRAPGDSISDADLAVLAEWGTDIANRVRGAVATVNDPRLRIADLADAFLGHRLCGPEPYQWGRDGEIPFHPNAAGHAALAARLSAVLDALVTEGAAAHR
jgi:lysophospholipase L1-like esterase